MDKERYIEVKGKRYPVEEDMEYDYTIRFRDMQERFAKGDLTDHEIENNVIGLMTKAICPTLKINMKDMSVEGQKLKLSDVRKLIIDLRTAFQITVTRQLQPLTQDTSPSAQVAKATVKN